MVMQQGAAAIHAGQLKLFVIGLYLFGLCTVVMPFYLVGINLLFFTTSVLSIVLFFLMAPSTFVLYTGRWLYILIFFFLLSVLARFNGYRISSYAYTLFFTGIFILMASNIRNALDRDQLKGILRFITWCFFGTMLVQQVCVSLGLPVVNINPEFSARFMAELSWFRVNSLSSEPSYGATIIVIIGYVYYCISDGFRGEWLRFWLPAIYLWIFFNSALATILVPILILVLISGRRWWLLPLLGLLLVPLLFIIESENRAILLIQQLDWNNIVDSFLAVDLSGAFRVIPAVFYVQQASPGSADFWLGHGVDYGSDYISRLMPGVESDMDFPGGMLPFFLFDYGVLCFAVFCTFLHRSISFGNRVAFWVIALFVMVNANFNTQLMWIFITLMYLARCFSNPLNNPQSAARNLVRAHETVE